MAGAPVLRPGSRRATRVPASGSSSRCVPPLLPKSPPKRCAPRLRTRVRRFTGERRLGRDLGTDLLRLNELRQRLDYFLDDFKTFAQIADLGQQLCLFRTQRGEG